MIILLYPNNIKKNYVKINNHANRGMDLEYLLNITNDLYIDKKRAYIYKKPTPLAIVKVNYKEKKITEAYFQKPSTLDYNGIYKGYYIEFDAKVTKKEYFPIDNVSKHQIEHIKNIYEAKGIVFLLIMIKDEYYVLMGQDFLNFLTHNERKSIPYSYIKEKGYEIKYSFNNGLDYLEVIDRIIEVDYEKRKIS